jgi:glutamate-ammonia-ligase adenylyltransferase
MGKLGARELNVSSDIDLIYVYDQDGETAAMPRAATASPTTNTSPRRCVKAIYTLIGDTTEHGFVFRVDLALRPNGNSGPPAISLGALEEYFQVQGREWERFAWLKSRVVAPRACSVATGSAGSSCAACAALRVPALPRLQRVRRAAGAAPPDPRTRRRRSAGRPERTNDVKLSRGGIREIEFIVQLLQVVRGGQFPELRTRATLDALPAWPRRPDAAGHRRRAGGGLRVLRQVEHRIQYLDDQQTHVLPTRDDDLAWIAAPWATPHCPPFLAELDAHRELVAQEFDALLGGGAGCSARAATAANQGAASTPDFDEFCWKACPTILRERVAGGASTRACWPARRGPLRCCA